MQQIHSLADHLLIAKPTLDDPYFSGSVTYICEHSADGALGVILNSQLEADYQELFEHLQFATLDSPTLKTKLLAGGPVSPERGFILHSPVGTWDSSLQVTDSIALSTSEDILTAIALNQGPDKARIALGYAGWEKGQLEAELKENSWLFVKATHELIFDTPIEQIWEKATQSLGIDWSQLSSYEGTA